MRFLNKAVFMILVNSIYSIGIYAQNKICFDRPSFYSLHKFTNTSSKQLLASFGWSPSENIDNPFASYFDVSLDYTLSSWKLTSQSNRNLYLLSKIGRPNVIIYQTDRNCYFNLLMAYSGGKSISQFKRKNYIISTFKVNECTIEFREYYNDYSDRQYSILIFNTLMLNKDIQTEKNRTTQTAKTVRNESAIPDEKIVEIEDNQFISTKTVERDHSKELIPEPTDDESNGNKTSKEKYIQKFIWEQVFNFDTSNLITANQNVTVEYDELKRNISEIETNLKIQKQKEIDIQPKDPFETTLDYKNRIGKIDQQYKELSFEKTKALQWRLRELENSQYASPSRLKIDLDQNKYNADKGIWQVKLYENDDVFEVDIKISPSEARILWSNRGTLTVTEIRKIYEQESKTILIGFQNQNEILTLKKINNYRNEEDKVFTKVEIEADYPGGIAAWRRYLSNNLDSEVPGSNGAPPGQYTVIVRFIVAKDGTISDVQAETSHGYGMEQETIRVIIKSGKWSPAMQNGKNVSAYKR